MLYFAVLTIYFFSSGLSFFGEQPCGSAYLASIAMDCRLAIFAFSSNKVFLKFSLLYFSTYFEYFDRNF